MARPASSPSSSDGLSARPTGVSPRDDSTGDASPRRGRLATGTPARSESTQADDVRPGDRLHAVGARALDAETVRVPLVEERVHVDKTVREGVVRVRTRTEAREEAVTLPGHREEVRIERTAVGEVVDAPRQPYREGDVLVIPVYEERLVTVKQLVLRELVRIRTDRVDTEDHSTVTLRRTVVEVEREGETAAFAPPTPGEPATAPPPLRRR